MSRRKPEGTTRVAKVFMSGRSQAVRIPAEFRFDTDEVLIRRDAATGDVILTPRLPLAELFAHFDACPDLKGWHFEREKEPLSDRNPFEDD